MLQHAVLTINTSRSSSSSSSSDSDNSHFVDIVKRVKWYHNDSDEAMLKLIGNKFGFVWLFSCGWAAKDLERVIKIFSMGSNHFVYFMI